MPKKKIMRRPVTGARGFKLKAMLVATEDKARMDAIGTVVDYGQSIGVLIGGSADFSAGEFDVWCKRASGDTTEDDRTRIVSFLVSHANLFSEVEVKPISPSPYAHGAPIEPQATVPEAPASEEPTSPSA